VTELARSEFARSLFELKEAFGEEGHFFLQEGTALLQTFDVISREVASREPSSVEKPAATVAPALWQGSE
jgi:hypothetical protein